MFPKLDLLNPVLLKLGLVVPLLPVFTKTPDGAESVPSKPNILFIYADDWGWGDLSCHGHTEIKTPNIDKLAGEGIDFYRFTVANPVSSPSRTALLTGNYPARYSIHSAISTHEKNAMSGMPDWLDPQVTLLPRLLKEAGYSTGHFGKWHLSLHGRNITPETPLPAAYGFDEAAVWTGPGPTAFENSSYADKEGQGSDPVAASYMTAAAAEHAIRFISEAGNRPFFVNLWIHETHTVISATEEDKRAYPDTPEPQRTLYSAITRADRIIGEVLDTLQKMGLADNTLVIFSSDNGPEDPHLNPDHVRYFSVGSTHGLRGRKRSLYMGGVNTPFIVRWPGKIPAGKVDATSIISNVDMLPTLLEVAGVSLPEGYNPDGVSVLKAFKGKKFIRRNPLFWEWRGPYNKEANWPELSILDGKYVLLMAQKTGRIELYDIFKDRGQQNNLIEMYPKKADAMKKKLLEWKESLPDGPEVVE